MVDDFTLQTDRDNNGSYETTELIDAFTLDASGYADSQPTNDAAGNLTYDGVFAYTYDTWNRLVKITKAYRDPSSGDVTLGSVVAEYEYDALHRRIVRQVKNSGALTATYHDYYDGQSVVEVRNGSDAVLKQQVWGVTYIDELVQVAINGDPVDDPDFDPADADHDAAYYYAVHNANYNVQLVVDATGDPVERYEYAPYGERTVYISPGSNDPDCHAPTLLPQRVNVAGTDQPYAICDVGHQGLIHDDVSGLIYNRARMLHPRHGRFMQRDPAMYIDSMSGYQYVRSQPSVGMDPLGLWFVERDSSASRAIAKGDCGDTIYDLAKLIGLHVLEFRKWLEVADGGPMPTSFQRELGSTRTFSIPNTVVVTMGAVKYSWRYNIGDLLNFAGIFITKEANDFASDMRSEGFHVPNIAYATWKDVDRLLQNKDVYRWGFFGHGSGHGNLIDKDGELFNQSNLNVHHELNLVVLYACGAGKLKDNWLKLVAPRGSLRAVDENFIGTTIDWEDLPSIK